MFFFLFNLGLITMKGLQSSEVEENETWLFMLIPDRQVTLSRASRRHVKRYVM